MLILVGGLGYANSQLKVPTPSPVPTILPTLRSFPPQDLHYPDAERLFSLVQVWRESVGKNKYIHSENMCKIAQLRAEESVSDWSHDKFSAERFCDECTLGENLARNYQALEFEPEDGILERWLNSPAHKENLDRNYTHSCIRCVDLNCAHIFGYY